MTNKFCCTKKYPTYLAPLVSGFLGFLVGISGISNHLLFDYSERVLKNKLVNTPQEYTALSFTGLRTLFLTYVGISAGLAVSNGFNDRSKSQPKN